MTNYAHIIFFSLIGGVVSLVGGLLLLSRKKTANLLAHYATPFAAGALLAAAFFDLLPEALEKTAEGTATRWVLAGIIAFFLLEHFLHWFHHHHEHPGKAKGTTIPLIIVGDTIHNFLDGIAIGAAFLISVPTGIVAAVAVAAHEIPQEIGDFGLLLKQGMKRRQVIIVNVASALMSTIGAVLTFWVGSEAALPLGELLAITAGMFIYIAASDLIPTIHETSAKKTAHVAVVLLLLGVAVVGLTTEYAHDHIDTGHSHEKSKEHAHDGFEMADHDSLPAFVSLAIKKDAEAGYNLTAETKNFRYNPAAVGEGVKPGEGYVAVYVNDEETARLYGTSLYLPKVVPGDTIRVVLRVNDHRDIIHDGEPVSADITVEPEGSYKRYFDVVGH